MPLNQMAAETESPLTSSSAMELEAAATNAAGAESIKQDQSASPRSDVDAASSLVDHPAAALRPDVYSQDYDLHPVSGTVTQRSTTSSEARGTAAASGSSGSGGSCDGGVTQVRTTWPGRFQTVVVVTAGVFAAVCAGIRWAQFEYRQHYPCH